MRTMNTNIESLCGVIQQDKLKMTFFPWRQVLRCLLQERH